MTAFTAAHARVYAPAGRVSHLLPFGESPDLGFPSLCRRLPSASWLGTGSQAEYEKAASLPACAACTAAAAAAGAGIPRSPESSPAAVVTGTVRGTAAAASCPQPVPGAAAADFDRTGGTPHPGVPPVLKPAKEHLQAPNAEGGRPRARALAAVPIRGGQGTPSLSRAGSEGPQASPPESEGIQAGTEGGPGGDLAPAGSPQGPGRAARGPVAARPAPGSPGDEFRKTWRAALSARAKAQRAGRSRYPVKRAGDGYGPGMTRRPASPPGGTP